MIFKQKTNANYIKQKCGDTINIELLGEYLPFVMIRINPIHLEICEFIANNFFKLNHGSIEWEVLVNFLSLRSEKVKIITAIVLLAQKEEISEINVKYIGAEFSNFFEYEIFFHNPVSKNLNFIDESQIISSFIKYFPNKIYYLLRNRKLKSSTSVIRSWVDIDEELHKKHFNTATIYIYPFAINLIRGFKFIKHCFKKYRNVTLMGVPYSFNMLLKIFLSSKNKRDYSIIYYELDAMKRHSKEFIAFDFIFTSDEFIPAVNALYIEFLSRKNIVNNTHGIGFYDPYIRYTKMITFNTTQRNYYLRRNHQVEYSIKDYDSELIEFNKNLHTVIVMVDQGNLKRFGLFYEDKLQNRVISKIEEISNELNYSCFVKFHPNREIKEKNLFLNRHKAFKEISSFKNKDKVNYLFINLYSTAYYDFRNYGKFLFIKEELFDPTFFFGNSIKTVKINELEQTIISITSKI